MTAEAETTTDTKAQTEITGLLNTLTDDIVDLAADLSTRKNITLEHAYTAVDIGFRVLLSMPSPVSEFPE